MLFNIMEGFLQTNAYSFCYKTILEGNILN